MAMYQSVFTEMTNSASYDYRVSRGDIWALASALPLTNGVTCKSPNISGSLFLHLSNKRNGLNNI